MTPNERFDKYKGLVYYTLHKMWPTRDYQERTAKKYGMEPADFEQISLMSFWQCCVSHDQERTEEEFKAYVVQSVQKSLISTMRRKGSLIKYHQNDNERAIVSYLDYAPNSHEDNEITDMYPLIDSGVSVERSVMKRLILNEKLSVLREHERQLVLCKLDRKSQIEIEEITGMPVNKQNNTLSAAYKKLGIQRERKGSRKNQFIHMYNQGLPREAIMETLQIDRKAYGMYQSTYGKQLVSRKPVTANA